MIEYKIKEMYMIANEKTIHASSNEVDARNIGQPFGLQQ